MRAAGWRLLMDTPSPSWIMAIHYQKKAGVQAAKTVRTLATRITNNKANYYWYTKARKYDNKNRESVR